MKDYKQRIREEREKKDETQSKVAEELGIRYNVYQRYELGTAKMPIHHLEALADKYKVSADYLLGRTDERKPYPPSKED